MKSVRPISAFLLAGALFLLIGCSQGGSSVSPSVSLKPSETMPLAIDDQTGMNNSLGIMGAYQLSIDPSEMTAELITKRINAIGESYIISGMGYFVVSPCADCLTLRGMRLDGGQIALTFKIRHPFDPGDPGQPPTAKNRLDLDIFDFAMVVVPLSATSVNYPLTDVNIYSDIVTNASGYTKELANLISDQAAMPYVLIVDNNEDTPPYTWNKFPMGAESSFDVLFNLISGAQLEFDLFLTMGYGASATRPDRLAPKYYNPEFNRKAAWKVEMRQPNPILDNPSITTNIEVLVYDWQTGATVYGAADFENAPTDNVYAASEVAKVSVEIPGMNSTLPSATSPTDGTGMPDDPLVYVVPVSNENGLAPGTYTGIVKVTDERAPLPPDQGRDFLIHSENGIDRINYSIPEYATYQTFNVNVVHEGITLSQIDFEMDGVIIHDSNTGMVEFGYVPQPVPQYFNFEVGGSWVIQNAPILPGETDGAPQSVFFTFPLAVANGTDVSEASAGWAASTQEGGRPTTGDSYEVGDMKIKMKSGEEGFLITMYHIPVIIIGLLVADSGYVSDNDLPNQECGSMECVPASISNSLKYLHTRHGKPPTGKSTSIATMKTATNWTASGCSWPNWGNDKASYMTNNGYQITTEVIQNPTAANIDHALSELKNGQDVEMRTPGHAVALKGIMRLFNGTYIFVVSHDTQQGVAGGTITESVSYDPGTGKFTSGTWWNGRSLGGLVIECPTP